MSILISVVAFVLIHSVSAYTERPLVNPDDNKPGAFLKPPPGWSPDGSIRGLIDTHACANPPYTGSCTSNNPAGCPCTAFTDDERKQVLDYHNERRDLAASGGEQCWGGNCPSGTNINALIWDYNLEVVSTYWAHQCRGDNHLKGEFESPHHSHHFPNEEKAQYEALCNADPDNCKAKGYTNPCEVGVENCGGSSIGENMAMSGMHGGMEGEHGVLGLVKSWFDESRVFDWNTPSNQHPNPLNMNSPTVGHWTQAVKAKTRYVGCGYAQCTGNIPFGESWPKWLNVVCKYLPSDGGGMRAHPYEAGTQCSACEGDRNGCSGALCGGDMCLNCVVDFGLNRRECGYTPNTCPTDMLSGNGIDGTVVTARPVSPATEPAGGPSGPDAPHEMVVHKMRFTMIVEAEYSVFETEANGDVFGFAKRIVRAAIGITAGTIVVHGVHEGSIIITFDVTASADELALAKNNVDENIGRTLQVDQLSWKLLSNTPHAAGDSGKKGLSGGAIAGIVIAVLVVGIALRAVGYWYYKTKWTTGYQQAEAEAGG